MQPQEWLYSGNERVHEQGLRRGVRTQAQRHVIKDQMIDYEAHARLKEKAKNLMMDHMTKDLCQRQLHRVV